MPHPIFRAKGALCRRFVSMMLLYVAAGAALQPLAAQAPYGFGGVTAAGLPVSSQQGSSAGGFEHYSPFSGSLGLSVPLYHVGGRGDGGFDIVWNLQPNWIANRNGGTSSVVAIDPYPSNNIAGATSNAYALGGPGNVYIRTGAAWAYCNGSYSPSSTQTTLVFVTGTGAQINLVDTATSGAAANIANPCSGQPTFPWYQNRGTLFQSNDGTAIQFTADNQVSEQSPYSGNGGYGVAKVSGVMVFPNGVTYRIDNSTVSWIRDRNGNLIKLTYGGPSYNIDWYLQVPALTSVLDSLNYVTTVTYSDSSCGGCLSVTYPGAAQGHKVEVATAILSSSTLRPGSGYSLMPIASLFPDAPGQPNGYNYTPTVTTAITLPDNTQYSFQYNSYGEVARMVLPTGASIEYDYGDGLNGTADGYQSGSGGQVMIYRRLQERREYQAGGTGNNYDLRTHYTVSYPSGQTVDKQQSFFNSSSTVVAQTIHTMSGSPTDALSMTGTSCNNSEEGAELQTDVGAPSPLVTTNFTYPASTVSCTAPALASAKAVTLQDANTKSVATSSYTYDTYGNVTDQKDTDWSGNVIREIATVYQYHSNSDYAAASVNLVRLPSSSIVSDGHGNQIAENRWRYDENTSLPPTPGIVGYDANYSNSLRGNVTSSDQWIGGGSFIGTSYSYGNAGNVLSTTDPDGHTLTMTYDDGSGSYAFPTSVTNGLNQTTRFGYYYGARKVGTVIDPLNNTTTYTYDDAFDRVTCITQPSLAQTNIVYQTPTWVITSQDQVIPGDRAIQTQVVYDNFGRVIENRLMVDANDLIDHEYGYDGLGRRTQAANPTNIYIPNWTTDGYNYVTTTTYDSLNRPVAVTTPFGNPGQGVTTQTTQIAYQGYKTTVTDPAKAVKQTTSDVFGHVASVIEDVGYSNFQTNYFYDPLGDLTTVVKCAAGYSGSYCTNGQKRTFAYDGLGRLTQANNPESNTFTYSYVDSNGVNRLALQSRTDPRNVSATYSYDAAGRTIGIGYNDGVTPSDTYSYDAAGRLTQSSTGYVVNNYTSFDSNGRVLKSNVQISGGTPYTFQYAYDLAGELTSETYPTGRVLNTTYDAAGRPAAMAAQGAAKPYVVQAGYWPSGAGYYWQYGNTLYPVENYSAQLTPWYTNAALNNDGNSYLMALGIIRNADGTVQQTSEAFGPAGGYFSLTFLYQNYNYDRLKRLLAVVDTNYSRGFNYDEFGNMSVSEDGTIAVKSGLTPLSGGTLPNPYDPGTNRLLSAGYDARGDITTLGTTTMTYDAEGRQIGTTDSGTAQSIAYAFDAEGQRVAKQVAGGATVIDVHDAFGQLAVEYSSASLTAACNTCYLAYDGVGSVRLVTDENGNVVARHDYLPYGEEIPNGAAGRSGKFASPSNLTQGFTGQELDGATSTMTSGTAELEYFNARHMSAVLGSFTQPDPMQAGADFLNPQSWNGYAYAGGQPLVYTDPSGMNWFSGIGATISSIFSSLFGSGNDGCDPGVDFCGGTVQSGGVETVGSSGGGGLSFSGGGGSSGGGGGGGGSAYDNGDVFRATSFISNPAKNLTGPIKVLDCAGYTAARSVLPQTKTQGIEFGGFIYKNNQSSSYFYSAPFSGTPGALPSFDVHRTQDTPGGFSLAGWYHSHPLVPNYPHPELFSGADLGATRRVGGPGYLLTPNGDILKLLPYPPNAPVAPTRVSPNACQGS